MNFKVCWLLKIAYTVYKTFGINNWRESGGM